jgi:hypothetical protein
VLPSDQQKASAEVQKKVKFKTETHENNAIDIDNFSDEFERLDELPEIQESMDNMDMEVSTTDLPQTVKQDTNPFPTSGLTLEVSAAVIISCESESTSILLNKVLLDTGCTRTIIKRDKLPDKFFESKNQINEVSWTANAGKFVTKYKIPLQFLLPEFAPSCEINWSVAVHDTAQQSKYDMIIACDLCLFLMPNMKRQI